MSNVEALHHRPPSEGDRDGNWVWDGTRWVCVPCGGEERPPIPCGPFYDPPQVPWYPGANGGVSFGLNPPQNPIRGHFWWNGVLLQMFDGAAWVGIGPEPATTP
jgi:hypothetical protein